MQSLYMAMDEFDKRLITHLETHGFQKNSTLAHLFGVAERTMHRRVNNIIRDNLIKVIAVPNFMLFGNRGWARIGVNVAPGYLSRVARMLVENPSTHFVAYTLGRFDILISVFFETIDELTYFVDTELTKIRGIQSTETMLLMSTRKYNLFYWPASASYSDKNISERKHISIGNASQYQIDELDRSILDSLKENGLISPTSLASKLNVGVNTIRRHLKNMLQNEVYKLEVIPITDVLEYEAQATIGITINNKPPHQILDAILEHPAVYLASVALGKFNLLVAVRFRSTKLLNEFTTSFLPSISGISYTETFLYSKRLKYRNITWPIA